MSYLVKCCRAAWFALAIAGCGSSETLNLGDGHVSVIGASLEDYRGDWKGYVELFRFDDETDTVRLHLETSGNGTLRVGETAILPPPQPGAFYPPAVSASSLSGSRSGSRPRGDAGLAGLHSGFEYPVNDAMVENQRLRLSTKPSEVFKAFCALQAPVPRWGIDFAAAAAAGTGIAGGAAPSLIYDCPQVQVSSSTNPDLIECTDEQGELTPCELAQCSPVCECMQSGCRARESQEEETVLLDATLLGDGNQLQGSLMLSGQVRFVRLTHQ